MTTTATLSVSDDQLDDPALLESGLVRILDRSKLVPTRVVWALARRLEGGTFRSRTMRRILQRQGVSFGAYSYGGLFDRNVESGLTVGRYVSIARYVRWGLAHPIERFSQNPVFYQPRFGISGEQTASLGRLEICHDAWIGEMVTITERCRRIGIGAVVGANSVVTADVPDFAIVFGSPARIRRYRFPADIRDLLLRSRWWDRSPEDFMRWRDVLSRPADDPQLQDMLRCLAAEVSVR